jgi:translation initiation factor IF-2
MAKKQTETRVVNTPQSKDNSGKTLYFRPGMSIAEVADATGIKTADIIKKLMGLGVMASQNQTVEQDTIELVMVDFDVTVVDEVVTDVNRYDEFEIIDDPKDLTLRPAVVTIMGHVDHGKTTLLDAIRQTKVVDGEFGGITQHIGAYQVEQKGQKITFLDTPGHAAFTEMRARGASITDIVILVVAADDGVMPQTKEAVDHAKAAGVTIIVAVNKMDKPSANPDRVKTELAEMGLAPEEWGGSTLYVEVSALIKMGIDDLLDTIQLVAELEEYKANPNRLGVGAVIEAKLDKTTGPVATLLVQNGTIRIRDIIVVGNTYGRIRLMKDDQGRSIKEAGPSMPVEIAGISDVPNAGDRFMVFTDEKEARQVAEARAFQVWKTEKTTSQAARLENLFDGMQQGEHHSLPLIIKGDVQGSVEALKGAILQINVPSVTLDIVRSGVGTITETDISLAQASGAIVIGFNVRPTAAVRNLAQEQNIDIRLHNIIYKVIEELEDAMTGMLAPVFVEQITGQAEVRDLFKASKVGTIAGCYVTDGSMISHTQVRLIRNGVVIFTGKMSSLKRFKDDAKEVNRGYECGITLDGFNDIKVGDIIEGFRDVEEAT